MSFPYVSLNTLSVLLSLCQGVTCDKRRVVETQHYVYVGVYIAMVHYVYILVAPNWFMYAKAHIYFALRKLAKPIVECLDANFHDQTIHGRSRSCDHGAYDTL